MLKLFSLLTNLVFIANYGLCSTIFIYFLNWFDTGEWVSDGWNFMLGAGLVCGLPALIFELRLFRKVGFWPGPLALYLARQCACGIAVLSISFALSNSAAMMVYSVSSQQNPGILLASFILIPSMSAFYLPLIAPFGAVVGLINGVLFRIVRTSQGYERAAIFR